MAFLGGSITFNPGWRDAVTRYLEVRFPGTTFEFIAAGIPSLSSVPHAFRLERDVPSCGPLDLLFVEAAVNDHNYDGQTNATALALRGMEGVLRQVRRSSPQTDVVELHFFHDPHLRTWDVNTATPWSQSLHLPWALLLDDALPAGTHTVRVRLVNGALRVFHLLED